MSAIVIRRGKKVNLCLISRDDLETIRDTINDPDVNKFLRNPAGLYFPEDEQDWYENLRKNKETDRVLSIHPTGEDKPAGVIGLHHRDSVNGHAEIGFLLDKKHWNMGLMGEAISLMIDYGKDAWNLRKIYAFVKMGNDASVVVLRKNGFQNCGTFKDHDYVPGTGFVDLLAFERMLL